MRVINLQNLPEPPNSFYVLFQGLTPFPLEFFSYLRASPYSSLVASYKFQ